MNRSRHCSEKDRRKTIRHWGGEPHPASGRVDEGREVSSTIEEEREEVVERVGAL